MLQLKNIIKTYKTGDYEQKALNDVSINFRKNEFAAILGPSGSGKTTMLNIVGGLDNYTSGDLIINNISTKEYKDSDWDSYRNHKIGFVFQSYNLISHQTVLQNVILALTLSGISKHESLERARKVLVDVGLKDHLNKKPNQLSGGQMQRVAIARALVNNPDILLADEPTGALDSETSVQIMELLKEIAKDKLVIMVTHNPELAEKYANRVIKLQDGKIKSDTNPLNKKDKSLEIDNSTKTEKTNMSFLTALGLSFNNLMTKKGRTILAAFAGSIGIIGIALILSLSTGFQNYIDKLQEDTLSSYPLTITSETMDMSSMLMSMVSEEEVDVPEGMVNEQQFITSMFSSISTNDLKSFKKYIEEHKNKLEKNVTSIKYSYSIDPLIYTKTPESKIVQVNPNSIFTSMYGSTGVTSMYSSYSSIFTQMTDDMKSLEEQYEVVAGRWPKEYNEMILVLSQENTIPDMLLYFLGLRDIEKLYEIVEKVMSGEVVDAADEPLQLTYEDLMNIELKLINQYETYKYNKKYDIYENMSNDTKYMENLYNESLNIKIVGIVTAKEGTSSMALSPGVAYKSSLIEHIINTSLKSEIVQKQLSNEDIDVFSNKSFDEEEQESGLDFEDMISIDNKMLESAFNIKIDQNEMQKTTQSYMNKISDSITTNIDPAYQSFMNNLKEFSNNLFDGYINSPKQTMINPLDPNNPIIIISMNDVDIVIDEFMAQSSTQIQIKELEKKYIIPANIFENTYSQLLKGLLQGYISAYYSNDASLTIEESNQTAAVIPNMVESVINSFVSQAIVVTTANTMAQNMTEAVMQKSVLTNVGELTNVLMSSVSNAFDISPEKIASAFKFDLDEDELKRIMDAMLTSNSDKNAKSNLISLGYQDINEPTSISFYFNSFDSKEEFLNFIDKYNDEVTKTNEEEKVINYTDTTGILMGSVKKIVNSVSYVLIAFVSISLVVSSIMIGIITYISVLERIKEIGILRAIGASKRNISSIFNAETFIIGLLSGTFGIAITLILIPPINHIIHSLTDNEAIIVTLPVAGSIILIILSVVLTLIGGLIPSRQAAKKDPVVALRTE